MLQKYFITPFAFSGDKTSIPNATQPSGSVSFEQGFGFDYQRDLLTDPDAKPVPRQETNYLYAAITENIKQWQNFAFPEFITTADNGGAPYSYAKGMAVRFNPGSGFKTYISLADANTTDPTNATNWRELTAWAPATNGEAVAGTRTDVLVTPAGLAAAIAGFAVPDATTAVKGIQRNGTNAEVLAGLLSNVTVTPSALKPVVDAKVNSINGQFANGFSSYTGSVASQQGLWTIGWANGVPRWQHVLESGASLASYAYDAAGANGQQRFVVGAHNATYAVIYNYPIAVIGRVEATVTATNANSSTIRTATNAETIAGAALDVAVPPYVLKPLLDAKVNTVNPTTFDQWTSVGGANFGTEFGVAQWRYQNNNAAWSVNVSNAGGLLFYGFNSGGGSPSVRFQLYRSGEATSFQATGNGIVSGDMSAASFTIISARDKKNIDGPIGDALARVLKVNTYYGTFKHGTVDEVVDCEKRRLFYIADEMAAAVPEVTAHDENGNASGVDYGAMSPLHTAAIQDLYAIINNLRAEIAELKKEAK